MLTRYRLLAQIIVDEMHIMRLNILRWKAIHDLLGNYCCPSTLDEFEQETTWTHVLSARLLSVLTDYFLDVLSDRDDAGLIVALMARTPMRTLRCGTGNKEMNGQAR